MINKMEGMIKQFVTKFPACKYQIDILQQPEHKMGYHSCPVKWLGWNYATVFLHLKTLDSYN
jgi:hypothetical protein